MKVFVVVLIATLFGGTAVGAELPAKCAVAQSLISPEFALPRVAAAISKKQLDVLVVGAGSSTLAGAEAKAYPARLQFALTENLPGVTVKVRAEVKPGRTALDAVKTIVAALFIGCVVVLRERVLYIALPILFTAFLVPEVQVPDDSSANHQGRDEEDRA